MPKYLVTSGSHFTPFTYDELAKPLMQVQEAHNAAQDAYDTLSMQTEALREYISENEGDAEARRLYKNYTDKLTTLQNNLWEQGFTGQTRRDLAAARTAFSSNITPVAKAIQNRIERSKEYWDAKHKNPELILGMDPGTEGLDKYLHDENYGRNWFSYSGKDFENEVGAEVKARASALLDDISKGKVVANPDLPQTLTRIIGHGVTNDEINFASRIVDQMVDLTPEQRAAFYKKANLPDGVQILTESLLSRYDATGIKGSNASAEARQSLLNRGKAGWAQGVFEPNVKDFENPYFAQQMELDTYRRKKGIDAATKPPVNPEETGWEPTMDYVRLQNTDTAKQEAAIGNTFYGGYRDKAGNPIKKRIVGQDGKDHWVSSADEAAMYLMNTSARMTGMQDLDGLDVSLDIGHRDKNRQVSASGTYRVDTKFPGSASEQRAMKDKLGLGKDAVAVYMKDDNGNYVFDEVATAYYNDLRDEHNADMEAVRQKNTDIDWRKDVFDGNSARELRRKYKDKIPGLESVPDEDLRTAIQRATVKDMYVAVPNFVESQTGADDIRENAARSIQAFITNPPSSEKQGKSSGAVVYPVLAGGYEYDQNGIPAKDIFGYKGSRIDPDSILKIYVLPEDIARAKATGSDPMVRIETSYMVKDKNNHLVQKEGTYMMNSRALGDLYGALTDDRVTNRMSLLMEPILGSTMYLGMDDAFSDDWADTVEELGYFKRVPSAKVIIRNDDQWDNYYSHVVNMLTDILSKEIDLTTFKRRQHPGATSTKAAPSSNVRQ